MQRMKGQGNPVPNGPKEQNYSSFQNYTNPMTSSMAAAASDPYMSSFYMTSTPYQAFGVGDGTWSNGGEHMQTFLGGYGGQVGYDSHSAIDGIFSGGNFGGFNAPAPSFNYGFHGNGEFSAWGGSDVRGGTKTYDDYYPRNVYQDDRVKTLDPAVQALTLTDPKTIQDLPKDANGCHVATNGAAGEKISGGSSSPNTGESSIGSLNQPKKGLSWASVASQPAKPQPSRRRDKSTMSSIVPGRHMDIGTWEGKNGGPKPVAPPPAPRPAWEAPRGGSRSTTSTVYSTPPPRTPPQSTPMQQPPSPQMQTQPPQMVPSMQQSPQQSQQMPPQQSQQAPPQPQHPQQGSPQQQQSQPLINQQHHSPTSLLPGPSMREMSGSPQTGSPYGPPSLVGPQPSNSATFPSLDDLQLHNEYNPKEFDLSPQNARFFVIKSYSEDDIHRSIKYEIWCSTEHGNKRLDAAFRERETKGPIFLFFSVNGSGHFCGIAQMMSYVDYNCSSNVWAQDKWKGQFRVKWVYVKDVPNNPLRHIRLENNENKPVTNSRDTQEVPYEKGKQVLKIIHNYRHTTSIFDDFIHYEKRQEESEYRRGHHPAIKDVEREDGRNDSKDSRGADYREHREHRDHHRDYQRDYHRGGSGGGRGRGGHHHHRGSSGRQ